MDSVVEWEKMDEDVNIVPIHRNKHGEAECVKAKTVELQKFIDYNTYLQVEDLGQNFISTTWVLWNKGDEVRARLVVRGFEELEEVPKNSPTVTKSTFWLILHIAVCIYWTLVTTDIKSAFLQGNKLERKVHVKPPKEANVPEGYL